MLINWSKVLVPILFQGARYQSEISNNLENAYDKEPNADSRIQNIQSNLPRIDPLATKAIVLWHGLGDNYNSLSMNQIEYLIEKTMPGTFIHSIWLDENPSTDERRSFIGDANEQVSSVCDQLSNIPELKDGFGAIGFSQGGLFMRALIERCSKISVLTLITFGSPHMGVLELPLCERDNDWICKRRNEALKRQVWNPSVRKTVVPAQYFRDPNHYENYLKYSNFLADVNLERSGLFQKDAKDRFSKLRRLALVCFSQDKTLVPKESAFFQDINPHTGSINGFENTRLFQENLIGLQLLHSEGKIEFFIVDDTHMAFSDIFFVDLLKRFFRAANEV